jgi:hypothetical protein
VSTKADHLQIIPNVTVSNLLIFNSGDVVIKRSDIDPNDPLKIGIKNGAILEVKVSTNTVSSSPLELSTSENTTLLVFEYLNPCDGAIISLVHTGKSSSDIEVAGKVIGLGKISRKRYEAVPSSPVDTPGFEASYIGFALTIGLLFIPIIVFSEENRLFYLSLAVVLPLALSILYHFWRYKRQPLSSKLRAFYEYVD